MRVYENIYSYIFLFLSGHLTEILFLHVSPKLFFLKNRSIISFCCCVWFCRIFCNTLLFKPDGYQHFSSWASLKAQSTIHQKYPSIPSSLHYLSFFCNFFLSILEDFRQPMYFCPREWWLKLSPQLLRSACSICLYNMNCCLHCTKEDSNLWRQGERVERRRGKGNCATTKFSEWAELGCWLSYF